MNVLRSEFTPADLSCPWYPIDNAANLYAAARKKHWCRTYRASVLLTVPVEPETLQKALNDTCRRFTGVSKGIIERIGKENR